MLSLYHAPDLETLGELACALLAQPLSEPLAPALVFGQPPWTMKPLMMRWKAVPS